MWRCNKTPYGEKSLHTIFDKVEGYGTTKYLALFHSDEKSDEIFITVRYFIMLNSNISDAYSHKRSKIKINSDDDLPLQRTLNT